MRSIRRDAARILKNRPATYRLGNSRGAQSSGTGWVRREATTTEFGVLFSSGYDFDRI